MIYFVSVFDKYKLFICFFLVLVAYYWGFQVEVFAMPVGDGVDPTTDHYGVVGESVRVSTSSPFYYIFRGLYNE